MIQHNSNAFVFFGATGDLAYKKIFPALQALIRAGHLDSPIIGIALAGWTSYVNVHTTVWNTMAGSMPMRPLDPACVVRGQFRGYRDEKGVAEDSNVETFAALCLQIDTWRWSGVPFYIRAGKCLPVTTTERSG